MKNFADRMVEAVRRTKAPVVVGLDPRIESLPEWIRPADGASASWETQANAYLQFCRDVIDVVAPLVPAVKPQAAFFEQLGPAGMIALYEVVRYAREKQLLVIMDAKRNDIGSTATAYAHAYLGEQSAWGADSLTISPYLGDDSLTPFVEVARKTGSGLFCLVKTSNPGGQQFQDLLIDGRPLYQIVAEFVETLAMRTAGEQGYGAFGAVVGATYPEQLTELRSAMPTTWFLVPGYGSQGGGATDVAGGFDEQGLGAIVNNSRGIIFAHAQAEYREKYAPEQWQRAVEDATQAMIDALRTDTTAGRLV
ncbi:MAG: orotidine-5'-phosphate decarboxylase [Pirellulaceae bacterium]